jgi:predicted nuclease with TOPRIM domain
MSTTPRTDALEFNYATSGGGWGRPFDFARQLERELAVANERIANLEAGSIHSCHDHCQRVECVLRRRVAELEKERDEYKYAAESLDALYVNAARTIAELEQELAMSKSQFEAMAVAFTDNQRRLAELEQGKARLDHMDAITQPKGFRGHIDAAMEADK